MGNVLLKDEIEVFSQFQRKRRKLSLLARKTVLLYDFIY